MRYGLLKDDRVYEITGNIFSEYIVSSIAFDLEKVKLISPVSPSKVVAVGLNYKAHAIELGMDFPSEPILFLKPRETVIGPKQEIVYPSMSTRVDYEAELAIVIGRRAKNISERNAREYILGYTCANDVTARDLQKKDGQWTRAKSFDTFCPLGPIITDEIDPDNVYVRSYLNGQIKQDSSTKDLIFGVNYLVSFISKIMTLNPGDVILSGTPSGIGPMSPGDRVEIEVEGIGILENTVIKEDVNED